MLSESLHGRAVHGRFDVHEEPRTAGDALSSLKRSLAVNLNERERCRNKELQARQELQKAESALQLALSDLHEQRKEVAALRSQLEDQGIQQRRLQEKCKSHNTVGRCLEATVTKLRTEVRDGEKLYQEMTAWIEEESRGRRELVASSKGLTERFSQMEAALSTAEKNVVELQKDREVSQCKLAELQRGQMADKATHTVELKKLEAKAREAFTAKDDLYRDLLTLQKIQAEMKEALVQEQAATQNLHNQLNSEQDEGKRTQHELEQLKKDHMQLTYTHEEMSCCLKKLEESCRKLQEEKRELERVQAELRAKAIEASENHEQELSSMSDELKQHKAAYEALQTTLKEAQDSYAVLQKEQLDAAAAHESEASEIKTHATALQLELRQLQKGHQDLKRKNKDVLSDHSKVVEEKIVLEGQVQDMLQQMATLTSDLETAQASIGELEVTLVVRDVATRVCDADYCTEISNLTNKVDDAAKDLEKAQGTVQTLMQDSEQHALKRSELDAQINALAAQIKQERSSNELALEEKMKCMNAHKAKILNEVEKQAAEHVRKIQETTVQLQAEVSEKDCEILKLQNELAEVQRSVEKIQQDSTKVKEENLSNISKLQAAHAAALSSKSADASQLKTLLDETEAEKVEKVAELSRVQQALSVAQKKLGVEEEAHKEKIHALELELDQEQNQNEELEAQVAQLTESIDLEKCERKSIEAELEKSSILLRKYQGSQGTGADMTPLATPRNKSYHGNVLNTLDRNTLVMPGSGTKKRKRQGGAGHDSARQLEGKRSKRKNGAPPCSKSQGSKPPTAPQKKSASSSQMQRRGRLARMSNSAAGSDRVNGTQMDRNQAGTLTSTEIFGGLLLGNL